MIREKFQHIIVSEESYTDGQFIFKAGSPGNWVYFVLSGSVEISINIEGRKKVIEILGPGEVFGELGFIGEMKRTASAMAIGDTTVGVMDREYLEREYNKLSGQFRSILKRMTLRFKTMLERSAKSGIKSTEPSTQVLSLVYKDTGRFFNSYSSTGIYGGLFVRTEKPLDPGFQFILKMQLPGMTRPLKIKCKVKWSRKRSSEQKHLISGMALQFTEISDKDNESLKKIVGGGYLHQALKEHRDWITYDGKKGKRAQFDGQDLRGVNFEGVNLGNANLERANLGGAILRKVNFFNADLSMANMQGADVEGANLERSLLKIAKFTGASLNKARLQGADMTGADLRKATLLGSQLDEVDLRGADLRGTKNLTIEQLMRSRSLYGARLDEALEEKLKNLHPHLFEKF